MLGRVLMGRYELKRQLGEGGMGRVYLAREFNEERYVVVKIMHEHLVADAKSRDRFLRETELMGHFRHPNMVNLLDAVIEDSCGPFIVMEYIPGVGLDALLAKSKRFTPARVGRFLEQLCDVLDAAHNRGIIHRDLKPSNLMVMEPDSPQEHIKVMDFGLAKIFQTDGAPHRAVSDTGTDFAVGTPGYISPEQVRGDTVDHRSDLYSVGVIAYELLSGRLPFQRTSPMDMMLAHATDAPPTFRELKLRHWVPKEVEEVVLSCLDKDPAKRPATARELLDLYNAALAEAQVVDVEPVPEEAAEVTQAATDDSSGIFFEIDAWMPQEIARIKLRGFVHDNGGAVVESEPGRIVLELPNNYSASRGFSWFKSHGNSSAAGSTLDVELRLEQRDPQRDNHLHITVSFRPLDRDSARDPAWHGHCRHIFCEIRSYLMGH